MRGTKGTLILLAIAIALGVWIFLFERGPAPEGKALLAVDPNKIEKVELHNLKERKRIVLQRVGKESWRIVSPINTPANNDTVKFMLDRLKRVKIELALKEDALGKKEFGFREPQGAIAIEMRSGKRYKLVLAKKTPDALYAYAYREDKRKPVVVDSMLLDDALKGLDDLREKRVTRFDKDKANKLVLRHPDQTVVCERSGEEWQITKPLRTNADASPIGTALDKLSTLEASKFVDDNPTKESLRKYGLEKPSFIAEVWVKGRERPIWLHVGKKSSEDSTKLYARSSAGRSVFLIDESSLNDIRKRFNDLRSKRLLSFDTGEIDRVKLIHSGKEIELERRKRDDRDEWEMLKPKKMRADTTTVTNLLWDVHDLEAQSFIDQPKGLDEYGLDKPQASVELRDRKRNKTMRLLIGKHADGKTVYAKAADQGVVCKVPSDILDKVRKDVNELRNLEIVRFERDDVNQLAIEWLEEKKRKRVLVERRGNSWEVVKPKRINADSTAMSNILWTLEQVRADKYVDEVKEAKKYGFDKPQLTATVWLKGRKVIKLTIGAHDETKNNVHLISSQVDGVYLKSDYILDDLKRYARQLVK
ncbi:MAG: DUF4340 domain-containing protein [Armatimonadota bacterium]|nr:DUF4340 domain-containing protein [Armatimonadota bacterium]MCX7776662.1 DUF4340 domain-containing protein [Armatimonadota bacterium]MDW8025723.1 DUF4340 domain-containing protein [Armatimonadota bacterium]